MKNLLRFIKIELGSHAFDYSLFTFSGVLFLMALHAFKGQPLLELIILLVFIAFYILWGIYHHIMENSLHLKTVVEYILIGFTIFFLIKIILYP
ncbi:MAG: hypothetical protein ABIO02_00760 [Patescibacteria group bacterium]